MSAATTTPKASDESTYQAPTGGLAAVLATLIGLAAAVLALAGVFTHGLWPTLLHALVALTVFGLVRIAVFSALTGRIPQAFRDPDDA